jgi:hypothetical protein
MSDTIELLDIIGRDASLRHASVEDLATMLEQAQASQSLTAAAKDGDRSLLLAELGQKQNVPVQTTQSPSHEEEEEEDEEQEDNPAPEER